jgi:hypothetical protein
VELAPADDAVEVPLKVPDELPPCVVLALVLVPPDVVDELPLPPPFPHPGGWVPLGQQVPSQVQLIPAGHTRWGPQISAPGLIVCSEQPAEKAASRSARLTT